MSVKNSLCLFASVLALSACGSVDENQSENSAIVAPEASVEAEASAPSQEAVAPEDTTTGANAVDEVVPSTKLVIADEVKEDAPVAAKVPSGKKAKCKITSGGEVLKGPCLFESGEDGSFYVETDAIPGLGDQIDSISVTIIEKGVAEVRGLTKDGVNSRWGAAQRSATDKACWTGSDFEICAY